METRQAGEFICEYLGLVGLSPEVMGRYPVELIVAMKQHILVATALFLEPRLVTLYERGRALCMITDSHCHKSGKMPY